MDLSPGTPAPSQMLWPDESFAFSRANSSTPPGFPFVSLKFSSRVGFSGMEIFAHSVHPYSLTRFIRRVGCWLLSMAAEVAGIQLWRILSVAFGTGSVTYLESS